MERWLEDVELAGEHVTLKPLLRTHGSALVEAAADGRLWNLWYTAVPSATTVDRYLDVALEQKAKGLSLPFAIYHKAAGKFIGSTRFCNLDRENRRVEIGYTWYARAFQRTYVNADCKLLLLTHAFETANTIAVEFRTHWHNLASRRAIAGLGAKQDGILRNHRIEAGGTYRDTVVFSIIESEWPTVKKALEYRLQAST